MRVCIQNIHVYEQKFKYIMSMLLPWCQLHHFIFFLLCLMTIYKEHQSILDLQCYQEKRTCEIHQDCTIFPDIQGPTAAWWKMTQIQNNGKDVLFDIRFTEAAKMWKLNGETLNLYGYTMSNSCRDYCGDIDEDRVSPKSPKLIKIQPVQRHSPNQTALKI